MTRGREAGKEFSFSGKNQGIFTGSEAHRSICYRHNSMKILEAKYPKSLGEGLQKLKLGWLKLGMGAGRAERMKPKDETQLSSGDWVLERSPGCRLRGTH